MLLYIRTVYDYLITLEVKLPLTFRQIISLYLNKLAEISNLPAIYVDGKEYRYSFGTIEDPWKLEKSELEEKIQIYELTTNTAEDLYKNMVLIFAGKKIYGWGEDWDIPLNIPAEATLHHCFSIGPHYGSARSYYKTTFYRLLDSYRFDSDAEHKKKVLEKILTSKHVEIPSLYQVCLDFFQKYPQNLKNGALQKLNIYIREDLKKNNTCSKATSFEEFWLRQQLLFKKRLEAKIEKALTANTGELKNLLVEIKKYFGYQLIDAYMEKELYEKIAPGKYTSCIPDKFAQLWKQDEPSDKMVKFLEELVAIDRNINETNVKGKTILTYLFKRLPDTTALLQSIFLSQEFLKALDADHLLVFLKANRANPTLNADIASRYLLQQWHDYGFDRIKKIIIWFFNDTIQLQALKHAIWEADSYHHYFFLAQLHLRISDKESKEAKESYAKIIELLLIPRKNFFLSQSQLQILKEIKTLNGEWLSLPLLEGLELLFSHDEIPQQATKAYELFLQAGKKGWLLGYILTAQQREDENKLTEAIYYYRNTIFSVHIENSYLNQRCFKFALDKLEAFAINRKNAQALEILADYFFSKGKISQAIDYFIKLKDKVEKDNDSKLLFQATLALGKLFYTSGAITNACYEYHFGPAYLAMVNIHLNSIHTGPAESNTNEDTYKATEKKIPPALPLNAIVECYCQALITAYSPQPKEALQGLIDLAPHHILNKQAYLKIITAFTKFIDLGLEAKWPDLSPLLKKLLILLKLEILFPKFSFNPFAKLEFFSYKFLYAYRCTIYAQAFINLADENKDIAENYKIMMQKPKEAEKIIQFYESLLKNGDIKELPYIDHSLQQRLEDIINLFKENTEEQVKPSMTKSL